MMSKFQMDEEPIIDEIIKVELRSESPEHAEMIRILPEENNVNEIQRKDFGIFPDKKISIWIGATLILGLKILSSMRS